MKSFTAAVVDVRDRGGEVEAALDATAFYPGGGGQPPDAGHLGDRVVREAIEEDGTIWHRLDGSAAGPPAGMRIEGRLDWARRFDFMQQHTGQHILSRAFVDVAGADTKSFHLGEAAVTIDVEHAAPGRDLLERVEARANEVVWEDRPVSATWTTRAKAARLPLRKAPDVEGAVRIVEVEGFDWSACGGTHVASAGQVGLIHVLGTEKVKQGTRVSFLCGGRVLRRLRDAGSLLRGLALEFTAGEADLPRAVARLKEERAALDRRLRPLLREALDREAAALAASATNGAAGPVVMAYFQDRDPAELGPLAAGLAARGAVALLAAGGSGAEPARAQFSAPKGTIPVGTLLGALCKRHGGKGGGRPESAQGSFPADRVARALDDARTAALAGPDSELFR